MKKFKFLIFFTLALLLVFAYVTVYLAKNKAPEYEMMQASKMITLARNEKSPGFAKNSFEQAIRYYDSAMMEWKVQNEKFILFRNYQKVKYWALKSTGSSQKSVNNARKKLADTHELTEIRIEKITRQFNKFETFYSHFPHNQTLRKEITLCKLLNAESLQAYKNRNYGTCNTKLDSVEITLNLVIDHFQKILVDSFKAYPQWQKMVEQSIRQSKKNKTYVFIVDKMARELMVYKNGVLSHKYIIELSPNWLVNKQKQGDKATPEGFYKITDKKQNGQTKYYKALLLNYPNEEDKKRFVQNKKQGTIENHATIGNFIEIHGSGGKGIDWTDGCIALKNEEMDELFRICSLGTPVTIVGSIKSLNELSYPLK